MRWWASFVECSFRGNDFSGAQTSGAWFRSGIDLDAQKLPVDERFVLVRGAPATLERGRELGASLGSGERGSSADLDEGDRPCGPRERTGVEPEGTPTRLPIDAPGHGRAAGRTGE